MFEAIKLPYHIVAELVRMAVDRQLLRALGMRASDSPIDMGYAFTEEGKRWTIDALERWCAMPDPRRSPWRISPTR
jgi:hypothetical protein